MTEPQDALQATTVVGVDGSDSSRQAFELGLALRGPDRRRSRRGHLLELPTGYGMGGVASDWNPGEGARDLLAETIASVLGDSSRCRLHRWSGKEVPHRVVLDEAKDAQMLVVGSRGHGGFAGLLLGSVSAHCAEHAHCPVLVIHGKAH